MTWNIGTPTQHNTDRRERTRRLLSFGLPIVMAAALLTAISAAPADADPCGTGGNAITCENSKPGTPESVWDISGSGDSSIQGFATDISVNVGSRIDFKIDTNASNYSIDIYRTGWYQGLGARKIASVTPSAALPQSQPQCISDATTELYDCGNWAVSASWNVPSTAVSGVYVALLTRADTGGKSQITFVVRDEASHSDVLFQTSDTTWEAYNSYGGSDFYQGGANGRAYKISYNRPFATRDGITERDFYFDNQYPLVRFLEKNGYDVSYFSGVDTARFGSDLLNHHVFLSVGHDEYWSAQQRNNVTAARDAGVNLQFLSGNEGYWHTRWEPSVDPSATPYRTLVCYKETWANAKIDPSPEWTGTWRDPRFAPQSEGAGLPENALNGTIFRVNQGDLPITVSAQEGKLRIWRNTPLASLAAGTSKALAAHTIGYESDEDLDNGFRPAGLIHLSTTTGAVGQVLTDFGSTVAAGTTTHHLTMYRAASGALVFSAGSIQWTWGLDQDHDGNGAPADPNMQQAQVNLLADMGAQPASLVAPLVAASASTDHTAPVTTITSPAAGATIANGSAVTVTGTASDSGGQVAGVEVSTDGGTTWHAATGTTNWSYTYYQQGSGTQSVRARAIDDSGNYSATPPVTNVSVAGPFSVFGQETPATVDSGDASAVELGLQFTPNQNGFVSGVRFFKSTANTGTHTGSLWDASGNKLASVTFSGETASGWQTANFASPVAVTSGQTYVVSYSDPQGHYSAVSLYWSYRGRDAGPLTVAGGFGSQPAGVYNSTIGAFPTSSYQQSNYYVDAVFSPTSSSPSGVTVTSTSPASGATGVATDTTVTAQLSGAVASGTPTLALATGSGAVAGTSSYNTTSHVITFTPSAALAASTGYTATVSINGTTPTGGTWSFTTAGASGSGQYSLLSGVTPNTPADSDPSAVEVGMSFSTATAGSVTAIKFYKGTGNTGTHTGSLWSATGQRLASVTFTNETATGWQTAQLSSPVALTVGQTYVVSYFAPNGHYASTENYFTTAQTSGPLTAGATANGLYLYGSSSAFPTQTWNASNYFVDVVFTTGGSAPAPVTVTSTSPGSGATGVATNTTVTAQLSGAVSSGTPTLDLATGSGAVAGTSSYNTTSHVITFTPSAALAASTGYTATVSVNGTTPTGGTWSFTTAAAAPAPVTVTSTSPASGATGVSPTTKVTAQLSGASATAPSISLTSAAGPVAGTGSYDSTSHVVTFTPTSALAWTTNYTATVSVSGTALSGGTWSFTTADQPTTVTAQTIFATDASPDYPAWDDPNSVQVGVRFSSSVAGTVTGIRFYKGTQNTGTHQGYLWSSTGTLLATVTFANETATGWQSANFSQPVTIQPGVEYRASYHSSAGWYAVSLNALANPVTNGSLSTLASGGVYLYGTTYPNNVDNHNYWVDVYFVPAK